MCLAASKAASAFLRGFRDFVADRPVGAEGNGGAVAPTDMENKLNQSQPVGKIMPYSVSKIEEFPRAGLSRLRSINSGSSILS